MILSLGKRTTGLLATGKLLREGRQYIFRYESMQPREITVEHPINGLMQVVATASIRTISNLKFAMGDKILLDGASEPLTIRRVESRAVNSKQYMFVKRPFDTEYILDLA